jgi:L-2-hydroxyglutarate oxidase
MKYDFAIIGGGIVGICTAWKLQCRCPDKTVLLLEKEDSLAFHQSGHNSGVIHAGVYYEPGSLKAKLCRRGLYETIDLCNQFNIPYRQCGKLLVATNETELTRMHSLYGRCVENDVEAELISVNRLKEMEPHITGVGAIFVSETGIVDYRKICEVLAGEFKAAGGTIELNSEVDDISENESGITITMENGECQCNFLICCAGLHADRIARLHGLEIDFNIIPFRGEFYRLADRYKELISHLIYPIPDPNLPFLGVHITPMIDGTVTVGPNAVLGWKREGYGKFNFNINDSLDILTFKGFWRLMGQHFSYGLKELWVSLNKSAYVRQVRKYCPEIMIEDLLPHPAGIRAQAVYSDGRLAHDFLFYETPRSLHVCNAPSPAATSALPIAEYLCDKVTETIGNL